MPINISCQSDFVTFSSCDIILLDADMQLLEYHDMDV